MSWRDPLVHDRTTTTLYWHWPIKVGDKTRWERVTLLMVDNKNLRLTSPDQTSAKMTKEFQLRVAGLLEGDTDSALSQRLVQTREFMVAFAQQMVALRAARNA